MRRLISILIPIVVIIVALFGPLVWGAAPKWTIEWFSESGKFMVGAPQITFHSKADCKEFGEDRVALAEVVAGIHITFKCKTLPFIEAIR